MNLGIGLSERDNSSETRTMKRTRIVQAGWIVGTIAALCLGIFAGRATFIPPQVPERALPIATQTVTLASVGSTISLPVTARWLSHPLPSGLLSGMITSVPAEGARTVESGDVLLGINLRPVIVAEGSVPSFRSLAQGSNGEDVRQLQEFLHKNGFLSAQPSGEFGPATRIAVQNWQQSLGIPCTGTVDAGDIVFISKLPNTIILSDSARVGAIVSPGQTIFSELDSTPQFTATAGAQIQAGVVPMAGASLMIEAPGGLAIWNAIVTEASPDGFGGQVLFLAGTDDTSICGAECNLIPFTGNDITLLGRAITTPEVSGPALPPAAVGTAADGSRFVLNVDGVPIPVTVIAADATRVILDGVQVGDTVRLFATENVPGFE